MRKTLLRIALPLSIFLVVVFILYLFDLTIRIVTFAERLHPVMGQITFWGLIIFYFVCFIIPIILLLRLPKPLKPPSNEQAPEFDNHLKAVAGRLQKNPLLGGKSVSSRAEIENTLKVLDEHADKIIKITASQIFITTSISQRGSLDAILVLFAQSKLVWQLAFVYYQRPTLRDMIYLYANVATTAFIASEIEDIDLSEQIEPMLAAILGSAAEAVPGIQQISSVLLSSIMNGTANAFLTLRIGIITKSYCTALVVPDKKTVRKNAIIQAASMLGSITFDGSKRLTSAFTKACLNTVKKRAARVVQGASDIIKDKTKSLISKVKKSKADEMIEENKKEPGTLLQ